MNVLVACEYSGRVRDAFIRKGHRAVSVDLLPSESDYGLHVQGDVLEYLSLFSDRFDLMVCHPPCTDLAVSGSRHFKAKIADGRQERALDFVRALLAAPIPRICLENPVSVISSKIRKPDQIVQPWQFGHPETKATCLWLKGLPKLMPTAYARLEMLALPPSQRHRVHHMPPGPDRWKERSRTYLGIAEAMAAQWGAVDT